MKLTLWYAIDRDGTDGFYSQKPTRDPYSDSWDSEGTFYDPAEDLFSNVEVPEITWDDEPVAYECEITVTKKS